MTVSAAVGSAAAVTKRGQVLSSDPESALARVRSICLALPEAEEKISHGTAAFHVGGRMFAYFRHDHHRDGHTSVCVKTSGRDEQDMLMEADPAHFSWPAYIGPAGWIALSLSDADEHIWEVADHRIRASYELAAPPAALIARLSRASRGTTAATRSREPPATEISNPLLTIC